MYLCDKPSIERRAIDEGSHESEPSHDLIIDFFILVLLQIKRETERDRIHKLFILLPTYVYETIGEMLLHQFRIHIECAIDGAVGHKGMSLEEHLSNTSQTFQHLVQSSLSLSLFLVLFYKQIIYRSHANRKTIGAQYIYIYKIYMLNCDL